MLNRKPRTHLFILLSLAVCMATASAVPIPEGSDKCTTPAVKVIDLGEGKPGRIMDGLGVLVSHGKLFYDYDQPIRDLLMDYLFKPDSGASLQILKVEIGYDGNNTGMSWQCHHRPEDMKPDYSRGFGWWYMKEAKKRNPDLILTGLNWGYPGWAETDDQKAQFIYEFVDGARKEHGLHIDYIGGNQNEETIAPEVTVKLKKMLVENGYSDVKIIAADEGSKKPRYMVMDEFEKMPEYLDAIDVLGFHFKSRPSDFMPPATYELGKKVWSTEDGGGIPSSPNSAFQWVDQIIRLFTEVKMTAAIRWLATASIYENFPWPTGGIIKTCEPWSGHYQIGYNLWAFAHFTQFIPVGWRMIDTDDIYLYGIGASAKGRHISYLSPDGSEFSMVMSTFNDEFPETGVDVEIILPPGVREKPFYIWRSDFNDDDELFINKGSKNPSDGKLDLHLDPKCVYSITTTTGQSKGLPSIPSPDPQEFPIPYEDNFECYEIGEIPRYFVSASGMFEAAPATGRSGVVLRQIVRNAPYPWHRGSRHCTQPVVEIGDMAWRNYQVSVDALLEDAGEIMIGGRIDGIKESARDYQLQGYWLSLDEKGNWKLFRKDRAEDAMIELASGTTSFNLMRWTNLAISFDGNRIEAFIGGVRVASVSDDTWSSGNVTLAVKSHAAPTFYDYVEKIPNAQFDNFIIK